MCNIDVNIIFQNQCQFDIVHIHYCFSNHVLTFETFLRCGRSGVFQWQRVFVRAMENVWNKLSTSIRSQKQKHQSNINIHQNKQDVWFPTKHSSSFKYLSLGSRYNTYIFQQQLDIPPIRISTWYCTALRTYLHTHNVLQSFIL